MGENQKPVENGVNSKLWKNIESLTGPQRERFTENLRNYLDSEAQGQNPQITSVLKGVYRHAPGHKLRRLTEDDINTSEVMISAGLFLTFTAFHLIWKRCSRKQ